MNTGTDLQTFTRTAAALVAENDARQVAVMLADLVRLLDQSARRPIPEQRRPVRS